MFLKVRTKVIDLFTVFERHTRIKTNFRIVAAPRVRFFCGKAAGFNWEISTGRPWWERKSSQSFSARYRYQTGCLGKKIARDRIISLLSCGSNRKANLGKWRVFEWKHTDTTEELWIQQSQHSGTDGGHFLHMLHFFFWEGGILLQTKFVSMVAGHAAENVCGWWSEWPVWRNPCSESLPYHGPFPWWPPKCGKLHREIHLAPNLFTSLHVGWQ